MKRRKRTSPIRPVMWITVLAAAVVGGGIGGVLAHRANLAEASEQEEMPVEIVIDMDDSEPSAEMMEPAETKQELTAESETEHVTQTEPETEAVQKQDEVIVWNPQWTYGEYSAIYTGSAILHYAPPDVAKGHVVCVNAGHGTSGGSSVKTLCHPDGTPKVTSGSTEKGAVKATAVAGGTTLDDGTPEAKATLELALTVRDRLLAEGYDVLMIREGEDVQLDNIARTVIANQYADCHIALHYDSTQSDKGAFYMSVPNIASYRGMEPVASHWESHHRLGDALIQGLSGHEVKIFGEGSMGMDLTQTSYSTVPSVDLEVGDRASDHSEAQRKRLADGIAEGLNLFFGQ